MEKLGIKTTISIAVCILLACIFGCEQENTVNQRQERLYSVENMQLKKQINSLEKKYDKDITAKTTELEQCIEEKAELSQQLGNDAIKMFESDVVTSLMEQVQQLTKENAELKDKIAELEQSNTETTN